MISRKNTYIIIILIISLVIGGLIGFYFYTKNKNPGSTILGGSVGTRTNFGGYDPNTNTPSNSNNGDDSIIPKGDLTEVVIPKLRKISDTPTAGGDFVSLPIYEEVKPDAPKEKNIEPADNPNASATTTKASQKVTVSTKKPKQIGTKVVIRYMERGTGHIFETSSSTITNTRISNFTEPKIYEAYFVNSGDDLVLRNLIGNSDVISTRFASLVRASTTEGDNKRLDIKDLPIQISQMAISPSKTKIFSIMLDGVRGILSNVDGGSPVGIFNTQYKEWIPSWSEENNILLTTKASGFAPGFSYLLNTQTKSVKRMLGNIYGLTTNPSPSLEDVLFNESGNGTFTLNDLDVKNNLRYEVPFKTLAEKCIWAKTEKYVVYCAVPSNISFSTYPDVWYQGQINFADSIWKYNLQTGEGREIMDVSNDTGQVIDATNMAISPQDDYLVFINKVDLTFWGLQLVEPPKRYKINPLDAIDDASTSAGTTTTVKASTKSATSTK